MAGSVNSGQGSTPEVERFASLQQLGRCGWADCDVFERAPGWQGTEELIVGEKLLDLRWAVLVGQLVRLRTMNGYFFELVVAPDMIPMGVAIDQQHREIGQGRHGSLYAARAGAGVDQERALFPNDEVAEHALTLQRLLNGEHTGRRLRNAKPVERQGVGHDVTTTFQIQKSR